MNAKEFGSRIKSQRKSLGINQKYLAALCQTGVRFISDLENGKPTVQLEKAFHVAEVLQLQVKVLKDE